MGQGGRRREAAAGRLLTDSRRATTKGWPNGKTQLPKIRDGVAGWVCDGKNHRPAGSFPSPEASSAAGEMGARNGGEKCGSKENRNLGRRPPMAGLASIDCYSRRRAPVLPRRHPRHLSQPHLDRRRESRAGRRARRASKRARRCPTGIEVCIPAAALVLTSAVAQAETYRPSTPS